MLSTHQDRSSDPPSNKAPTSFLAHLLTTVNTPPLMGTSHTGRIAAQLMFPLYTPTFSAHPTGCFRMFSSKTLALHTAYNTWDALLLYSYACIDGAILPTGSSLEMHRRLLRYFTGRYYAGSSSNRMPPERGSQAVRFPVPTSIPCSLTFTS